MLSSVYFAIKYFRERRKLSVTCISSTKTFSSPRMM